MALREEDLGLTRNFPISLISCGMPIDVLRSVHEVPWMRVSSRAACPTPD
jgi:hypothetical protein